MVLFSYVFVLLTYTFVFPCLGNVCSNLQGKMTGNFRDFNESDEVTLGFSEMDGSCFLFILSKISNNGYLFWERIVLKNDQ